MAFLKNKLAVTIIVLSVSFLILIGISVKREKASIIENGAGATLNAVQGFSYKAGNVIKENLSFIFNFSKVKKENEELRAKNSELEQKALESDSLAKENTELREALNFKNQHSEYNYVGCDIIGKSGGNYLDGYIIDKGTKDNIKKGMVVVTARGLVGQVTSTASNWSVVQSISNENIAVSAMVESTNETSGILKGYKDADSKLLAKLYNLPEDSAIKKGDVILTSGYGNLYPKGIRIGQVVDVEEDKGKIMKNAVIEPYVDFNKLEEVLVIIPKDIRDIKY
ncbi:rod shape-determining protein MreC [Clostridium sp. YIM B02515]|uniref:Cell shape-determining protein MreC n=1 Tax=Clostridium rhizosphaerae TaxID=2803861 RepID=A0ABS1T7A0_9CLOT|nr:rod shape-determining protein MreC [Clostridium rhizosphaerae]MBL4935221.1 rod shape-determining protein MreC [Clostridium rhizosphaerae]